VHRVAAGAAQGALTWGAYSVVEHALSIWWPRLSGWDAVLTGADWRSIFSVLGAFVVIGAVAGVLASASFELLAAAGAAPRSTTGVRVRVLASFTLALAFGVNQLLVRPMGKTEALDLAVSLALGVALAVLACERGDRWARRFGFVADPFVTSLVLLGGGWTGRHALVGAAAPLQLAGAVAAVLLVGCAGAALWVGRGQPVRGPQAFRPLPAVTAVAVAGVLTFGGAALTNGRPRPGTIAGGQARAALPNIVLITMDTVRADHTSVGGYSRDTTPFLAELAHHATVYADATAPGDMTLSSHASLFTGYYPSWHGAHLAGPKFPLGRPLGNALPTLAGILASHGYRTLAVVANYGYLGPGFGLDRGFGAYEVIHRAIVNDRAFLRSGVLKLIAIPGSSAELDVTFARAGEVNGAAFAALRTAAPAQPFFLFLNYMDAHEPYVSPPPFDNMFPGRDPGFHHDDYLAAAGEVMSGKRQLSPAERAHLVSQYDGAIRYIDGRVSEVVSRLKELGVFDRAMVIVTSDHGESFGERGLLGHGTSVYQDQVHVPLLIKYPDRREPGVVTQPVSLVDLMPTVLSAAGLETPGGVQGEPLQRLGDPTARPVFSESFAHSGCIQRFERIERAMITEGTKLVVSTRGRRELYDLARDPDEIRNLFRADDSRAQDLLARLTEWVRAIPPLDKDAPQLDLDTLRRLKALGYVN
jgi:arylsulfatase A-like enzyme